MEAVEELTDRVAALVGEGRLEAALPLAEEALKIAEEKGEERHRRKARECRNNVAMVLQRLGRHSQAISLCEESVRAAREERESESEGKSVSESVTLMANLASLYVSVGEHGKALALCEEVAPLIAELKSHSEAPTVAAALHNLGALYERLGEKERAIETLEESLALSRSEIPSVDSEKRVGESLNSLACVLRRFGERERARELFTEALDIHMRTVGESHRQTLVVTENLALLEEDSGREAEAAALYASVLKGRSETLGERHKETVGVRSTLGFLYFAMGRMSEALPLLEGTLECMREEKGNEDADTLTAMKNVAVASRKSGDVARARELYSEILTVREKTLPPSHSLLRRSLDDLADVLLTQKEFSLALPLLERVATLSLSESGEEESLETARVLDSLAFVLEHCGERERAKSVYEDALRITRASVGESHEETAAALARVGDWHAAGDDYAAALAIYRQVLAIRIAALGPHDFDTENARVAIEQWEECL